MAQVAERFPEVVVDGSKSGALAHELRAFAAEVRGDEEPLPERTTGVIERVDAAKLQQQVVVRALLGLGFAAVWGLAAAASRPMMALANVYKVPMVLALSVVVSLPAVFTTGHLLRLNVKPIEVFGALMTSFYRAGLVLLGISPLLAVYAYTSQSVAPILAQCSAFVALSCGAISLRNELRRIDAPKAHVALLAWVSVVVTALALWQLVSLATPVLTLPTVFGSGIDGVVQ